MLFRQDDPADAGYVVISGSVALEREAEIPAPVRLMKGGSLIGLHALIVELERPATATAREKSLLLKLPRRLMLRVLEAFPNSAVAFRDNMWKGASPNRRARSSASPVRSMPWRHITG